MLSVFMRKRLFGNIEHIKDEHVQKKLLVCATEQGKRSAGGQHIRWSDAVTRDLTHLWIGLVLARRL